MAVNMLLKFAVLQPLRVPPLQQVLVQASVLHRRERFAPSEQNSPCSCH